MRIAQAIKSLAVSTLPYAPRKKHRGALRISLDPEVESVKFLIGDTKYVDAGPVVRLPEASNISSVATDSSAAIK